MAVASKFAGRQDCSGADDRGGKLKRPVASVDRWHPKVPYLPGRLQVVVMAVSGQLCVLKYGAEVPLRASQHSKRMQRSASRPSVL